MSTIARCYIWDVPSQNSNRDAKNDITEILSARAGGWYSIVGSVVPYIRSFKDRDKALLTFHLVKERHLGTVTPALTSHDQVDQIMLSREPDIFQRADWFLVWLHEETRYLGQMIGFEDIVTSDKHEQFQEVLAYTASVNMPEVLELMDYCEGNGWIFQDNGRLASRETQCKCKLLPAGYSHLAEIKGARTNSRQVFVAMWFGSVVQEAYDDGIAPAIRECGYEPLRIDRVEHIEMIDDKIIAEIRRSRFVIADFTSEPDRPRGGVYFEAGFAHGLNIPVIWTCRSDAIDRVHFDTRQFNHITWRDPVDLKERLVNRIRAVIV